MKLIKLTIEDEHAWIELKQEFTTAKERIIPAAINSETCDFKTYLRQLEESSKGVNLKEGIVPSDLYYLVDEKNHLLGAIDIRHELNDYLLNFGGHIGYGIRPSERQKGYASLMLKLGLEKCRELGLEKVLITCNKANHASAKTMIKNGAILENEVLQGNELIQRYWITL